MKPTGWDRGKNINYEIILDVFKIVWGMNLCLWSCNEGNCHSEYFFDNIWDFEFLNKYKVFVKDSPMKELNSIYK